MSVCMCVRFVCVCTLSHNIYKRGQYNIQYLLYYTDKHRRNVDMGSHSTQAYCSHNIQQVERKGKTFSNYVTLEGKNNTYITLLSLSDQFI